MVEIYNLKPYIISVIRLEKKFRMKLRELGLNWLKAKWVLSCFCEFGSFFLSLEMVSYQCKRLLQQGQRRSQYVKWKKL